MNVYGYARVSTTEQSLEVQRNKIKEYCNVRDFSLMDIYTDKASGKDINRTGFQAMMKGLENNPLQVEAIVFFKLDRIGRSLSDLLNIVGDLEEKKVGLISITDSIDTTSAQGRLFFHISGAFAEYEREIILERINAGKQLAREKGVKFGRKPVTEGKDIDISIINKKIEFGVSKSKIAKELGISRTTLYKLLAEERKKEEEETLGTSNV